MTRKSSDLATLVLRNLHDVFGEGDPVRRRTAIEEIFHETAIREPIRHEVRRRAVVQ